MTIDDPFADLDDGDATFIKPTPGGRFTPASQAAPQRNPPHAPPPPEAYSAPVDLPPRTGLNVLENSASNILDLLVGLKNTHSHADVGGLHRQLINEVKTFESKARSGGITDQQVLNRAKYVLCATLDDIVLNTPWGQQFGWSKKTLQGTFFRKEWAGDEFFKLLDRLIQDPANNLDLLELMYICLALGFKGGYRVYDRHSELEERREHLYRTIRNQRGESETELSPNWRGVRDEINPVIRYVPLWVLTAILALMLIFVYFFFHYRLNNFSDPVFAGLQAVGRNVMLPVREAPPPPPPPTAEAKSGVEKKPVITPEQAHQGLRQALLAEPCVDTGDVVIDQQGGAKVVGTYLRTNRNCKALFASGKWELTPSFRAVVERVAGIVSDTVKAAPGRILITGHTDNVPGRFISNAELSQRRAEAVTGVLINIIGSPGRFRSEGRGENEPITDNSTAEGRALNRRVEIMLLYPYVDI